MSESNPMKYPCDCTGAYLPAMTRQAPSSITTNVFGPNITFVGVCPNILCCRCKAETYIIPKEYRTAVYLATILFPYRLRSSHYKFLMDSHEGCPIFPRALLTFAHTGMFIPSFDEERRYRERFLRHFFLTTNRDIHDYGMEEIRRICLDGYGKDNWDESIHPTVEVLSKFPNLLEYKEPSEYYSHRIESFEIRCHEMFDKTKVAGF